MSDGGGKDSGLPARAFSKAGRIHVISAERSPACWNVAGWTHLTPSILSLHISHPFLSHLAAFKYKTDVATNEHCFLISLRPPDCPAA